MVHLTPVGRRTILVLCFLGIAALGAATGALPKPKRELPAPRVEFVPDELVVKLRPHRGGPLNVARARLLQGLQHHLGDPAVAEVRPLVTDARLQIVKLARSSDLARALAHAQSLTDVERVEPNYIYRAAVLPEAPQALPATSIQAARQSQWLGAPNDPEFSKTWGLQNVGQPDAVGQIGIAGADIHVLPLWQDGLYGSRHTLVAVIDTGIDWTHPDLLENLYTNPGESGAAEHDGIDNDGNGFVDDAHGWNFVKNSALSQDDQNHGTHCAGTIGAVGNNSRGVVGVNWEVSLLPIKFLDDTGAGRLSAAIESINYARKMKAQILSNSWGGGSYSALLEEAIAATRDAGQLFVAAAGNNAGNNDEFPTYPATYNVENIVAVAATDNRDGIASFSNYGASRVHVAAPGVKVFSTIRGGEYRAMSGTSMATPHVAGIAALLLSAHPEWSAAEIKSRLIAGSDPSYGLFRRSVSHGRVNAYNALKGVVPQPLPQPDESAWVEEAFALESAHPYARETQAVFEVAHPGAKFIKVHFASADIEARYDALLIQNLEGATLDSFSGIRSDFWSEWVPGERARVVLQSDDSVERAGFVIDRIAFIE